MSNIYNHNRTPFQFKLDRSQCWDFFLSIDEMCWNGYMGDGELVEGCLSAYIDTDDPNCVSDGGLMSNSEFLWGDYVNNGLTLENIGFTGVDNGFIHYDKTRITNSEFIELFTNSKYEISDDNMRLILNKVDGNNQIFYYGNDFVEHDGLNVSQLNGGFYQGFYKSGCDYQILPTNIGHGVSLEFTFKKSDSVANDDEYTLNDRYPENKGIFFFWGTRAENKWWEKYDTEKVFDQFFNEYFSDDYFADGYMSIVAPTEYFIQSEPINYISDDYLSDGYMDDDCGEGGCKCQCDKESNSIGDIGIKFTYPEALNTYQRNSKWFTTNGGLWIENEDWTTNYSGSGKSYCGKCNCNGGYFRDGYMSEKTPSCDCLDYVNDDYSKPDVTIDPFTDLYTKDGHDVSQPNVVEIETDNKFIIFDRTCDGYTVDTWHEGDTMLLTDIRPSEKENYFLLFDRTCHGMTADNFKRENKSYNVMKDLYRNAFALQVKDDGSIGYKYMVQDCDGDDDYKIESEFSEPDIITDDEWFTVHIKIEPLGKIYKVKDTVTSAEQKIRIYFYVNGKLVLISKELPTFNFRELNDTPDKQEGVPFNISVGGGTQGLSDVIYYNFNELPKYALPLEKEFGGSFIGYFKSFKFYDCQLTFSEITQNYLFERSFIEKINYLY